ncbi:MAG: superoxide dismutase [Povalibacter sp.]
MKDNVARQTYPFNLPDLPYAYDALEPHIDAKTLRIHHHEHHGTYVKKLNEALSETPQLQKLTLAELLSNTDSLPAEIRAAVKNNGGGHFNHDLFWRSMTPSTSREPRDELATVLAQTFGSVEAFRTKFSDTAAKHFASGWVALAFVNATKKLVILELKDHEVVHAPDATVLFILDVWEHAYYVKYQNRRAEFITAFWKLVDWEQAEQRFSRCSAASGV